MRAEPPRSSRSAPEFVSVGMVLGASGVSGAVGVRPLTEFPERLLELGRVRVSPTGPAGPRPQWRDVLSSEKKGDVFVLTLDGVTGREEAAALRGALLEIPVGEVKPLPPGHYYRFEIIGLEVSDESGRTLGVVRSILETGANDVYVIGPEGGADSRDELLIPAIKDVVLEIDLAAGRMVVRPQPVWGQRERGEDEV